MFGVLLGNHEGLRETYTPPEEQQRWTLQNWQSGLSNTLNGEPGGRWKVMMWFSTKWMSTSNVNGSIYSKTAVLQKSEATVEDAQGANYWPNLAN